MDRPACDHCGSTKVEPNSTRRMPPTMEQKENLILDFIQIEEGQEKDPICGMDVDTNHAEYQSEYRGKKYYFCCSGCLEKFESEPLVYV